MVVQQLQPEPCLKPGNSDRGDTNLAGDELFTAMNAKISSLGDAELTILELMVHTLMMLISTISAASA